MTPQFLPNVLALTARAGVLAALFAAPVKADGLQADTARAIDAIIAKALPGSVTPSVSIAIVKDGKLAYVQAYGAAQLAPEMAATPAMRYKIASNSKQITATAIFAAGRRAQAVAR